MECLGMGEAVLRAHKPRAAVGLNLCFCLTGQAFPWAGGGIWMVIGMCLSSQSKTNIKISASISSHVTSNTGMELDWMPFSEGQTHKEGFLGGWESLLSTYGCCCSFFSGAFQAFCSSVGYWILTMCDLWRNLAFLCKSLTSLRVSSLVC